MSNKPASPAKPWRSRIIAIDGPAASGKGTLARRIAETLGFAHLDTGLLYRAVAFEVLEHIEDIAACLQTFRAVLKPNGYLGFTVPNYDRRLNYPTLNEAIHQDCPPIHLNYWMRTSLENTLQTFGFISLFLRVRSRPYISWHHPRNVVNNYIRYLLGKYYGPTILCVAQKT